LPEFDCKFYPIFDESTLFVYQSWIIVNVQPDFNDNKYLTELIWPVIGHLTLDCNTFNL